MVVAAIIIDALLGNGGWQVGLSGVDRIRVRDG